MVEVVDTVVDELRMGVERAVLVLEEAILDLFVQRILHRSDRLARHDRDVVIAHVVGRCAELDALVVVDVAVLRIAANRITISTCLICSRIRATSCCKSRRLSGGKNRVLRFIITKL